MATISGVLAHLRAVFSRTPWYAELASAVTAIAWGIALAAAPDAVDIWPPMPSLLKIARIEFWECAGIVGGMIQVMCLIADRRWLRWLAAIGMCWFYAILTLAVRSSVPWLPGVAIYAGWVAINVFSILRLLRRNG